MVTSRILEDNIDAALKYDACDTVTGAIDTIVVSDDGKVITDIPNRTVMYQGQTPQSFKVSLFKKLYNFEFPQNAKNVSRGTCDATYKQENV